MDCRSRNSSRRNQQGFWITFFNRFSFSIGLYGWCIERGWFCLSFDGLRVGIWWDWIRIWCVLRSCCRRWGKILIWLFLRLLRRSLVLFSLLMSCRITRTNYWLLRMAQQAARNSKTPSLPFSTTPQYSPSPQSHSPLALPNTQPISQSYTPRTNFPPTLLSP